MNLLKKDNSLYGQALKLATSAKPKLTQAAALLEMSHKQGDARATYALATWHLYGHAGYVKNLKVAFELLSVAANADIAESHFDLAVCYETGEGTKKNEKLAYRHYVAAALAEDKQALVEVGRCHYFGIGTKKAVELAEIWFRRAEKVGAEVI